MKFILEGNPVSTNTIYQFVCRGRFPMMYMTDRGHSLKEYYQLKVKSEYKNPLLEGNLKIKVKLYFKDKRKHDIDNYNKILLDSLTGIVYKDIAKFKK